MDDVTFKQLRASKYYSPEITEVMFDSDMMLAMSSDSINLATKGFDIVWDEVMFAFICKYFEDGILYAQNVAKEKGIKLRLILEVTANNLPFLDQLTYYEIRHLDDLRGNLGIFDNRAYMVQIFHKQNELPDQTLWSNSKALVSKQQILFDKMWEIATPFSIRRKELEYEDKSDYQHTIKSYGEIQNEIHSLIEQTKSRLLIFSPTSMIRNVFPPNSFINSFSDPLSKGVDIKILTDNVNNYLLNQVSIMNNIILASRIQLGFTDKLGEFNNFSIVSDSRYVYQIRSEQNHKFEASFSTAQHNILIQEILFEKYWNEVNSLSMTNQQ
ncbi:MAG TPA: hypothetical protein VFG45_05880 [Candidatus Nitrosocosmicus sp.]|nr:hypothetical protein [Candidatus Nitrosocosmicus sp.]